MGKETAKPSLIRIAELLLANGVEFIVVGGQAAVLHGSPIPTYDVDLTYRRTEENLERLAGALQTLHPTLRGAPPNLPFILDAKSLALGANFTFETSIGPLDLVGWLDPLGTYDDVVGRAEVVEVAGLSLRILSLDDLITIKRHIGRPKDRAVLVQLEAIQRLHDKSNNS